MVDGMTRIAAGPVRSSDERRRPSSSATDHVVLLDERGRPCGTARKSLVHCLDTPLHLALSCYVVRSDGRLLLTRRSGHKKTFPSVWTNACCGHPQPGEPMEHAVRRHLRDELGMAAERLRVALPDFAYRAAMDNGIVEHELCPVFIASSDDTPMLDPDEADAMEWVTWDELCDRAAHRPETLSLWSVTQVRRLANLTTDPLRWLDEADHSPAAPINRIEERPTDPFDVMGGRVEQVMRDFVEAAALELVGLEPLAAELCQPIRALLDAGGKRLRPCLVYCGYEAGSGNGGPVAEHDLAHVAAAVEMLHTFALLHDDVMDRSLLRRGQLTAHERFDALHARTRPRGDAAWFGTSAAFIAGDLAFVWADQLLDRLRGDEQQQRDVRRLYGQLRHEVIVGQYLDIRLAGPHATDQQAQVVALLKSGRYTVTRPLELGASLAGASESTASALRAFGDAAGVAFQLRDDIIGVFGDVSVTGKGCSDDIRSGKASLLLVRALELAAPAQRALLRAGLGNEELDEAGVDACREAVRSSGAVASIERLIDAELDTARHAVRFLPDHVQDRLISLSELLAHRMA